METPNASSLPRADPGRIPTQPEGQFSSDSHYEESVPSLNRAQPHPLGGKITAHKTTVGTIVGLYLVGTLKYQPIEVDFANTATALLCSILHYIFFDRLHGSIASGEHARISQSQTTFISLLLVTIFKASLLGSVGICSVQYLWRVLRGQPIVLSRVENLFQMRHNPLELFYCHTFISVSFLLAAYTWIVPLATIYPPSALTISATPSLSTESVHLPVPQLVFDSNFNPSVPENVSRIAQFAYVNHEKYSWNNDETISGKVNLSTNLQVLNPQPLLLRLSESVIAAGEVVLNPPATITENSTYMLKFMGPQLSCRNVELFNQTVFDEGGFTDFALGKPALSRYPAETAVGTSAMNEAYMMNGNYEWQIFQQNAIGDALCQDPHENSPASDRFAALLRGDNRSLIHELLTDRFLLETSRTNCTERYVNYILNITYTKGVRSLQYTTHNIEPQPAKDLSIMMVWEAASDVVLPGYGQPRNATIDAMFAASPYFQRSREYLEEKFRYWNAFTIYAAFLDTIESATYRECSTRQMGPKCNIEWTRSNGASAAYGPMRCFSRVETTSILENSRLNPYRYSISSKESSGTSDLNVTEASLNDLLTNITISLMALDLWTDDVNVTTTAYRNTYDFSRRINLILPYALCLAFGLLIVGLGLCSLWHNGVPASDGFMQVMVATRGRTEMERLVLKESLVGSEKASQELMGLKVRYGELVSVDTIKEDRVWGFGTVEETVSIRKRN